MQAAISTSDFDQAIGRIPLMVNATRLAILISLLTIFFMFREAEYGLINMASVPFIIWSMVYGAAIVFSLFIPRLGNPNSRWPAAYDLFDILMIVGLMHLTGGVSSGFGILLLPFIATACLLSTGKHALIYALFASILTLLSTAVLQEVPISQWLQDPNIKRHFFSAALLSICCFLVASLTSFIAVNVRKSNQSVHSHAQEIVKLNHLSDLVLNRLQEAVVVLDTKSNVWLYNSQASLYFPNLSVSDDHSLFAPLIHMWQAAPQQSFDLDYTLLDEDLHIRAKPLLNQNPPLLILFMRPQHEIAAEAESSKLASLGQLTANIAHEIRNPLSAIRHANELLRESYETRPMQKLGMMIESNVQRIDQMVEEVLTLNQRDHLRPERIDLNVFLDTFMQDFLQLNPEAKGCIQVHSHKRQTIVIFDAVHLQQILWNLLNNAWRHSLKDSSAIQLSLKPHVREGLLSLQVLDNGSGVAAENVEKIFEPFFTTEARGTGLGLYVARTLAQANRGDLNYLTNFKAFELTLPTQQHHEYTS